jgi:hypothetical protein
MTTAVIDRGRGEVVFVLLLLQGTAGLLGALGVLAFMGNPVFLVVPLIGPLVQFVLAGFALRGRRWAYRAVLVMEALFLLAFMVNGLFGMAAEVDMTITLTGLLTRLALPYVLIYLSIRELMTMRGSA